MINIIDYIPYGKKNAVSMLYLMKQTGLTNREIRRALEYARRTDAIVNLQDGTGYFQPTKKDEMDVRRYLKQEMSRSNSIMKSLKGVKKYIKEL